MSGKDGGAAFPQITHIQTPNSVSWQTPTWSQVRTSGGMSLRDWFAGQIYAAAVTNNNLLDDLAETKPEKKLSAVVAEFSYLGADALLKAREDQK